MSLSVCIKHSLSSLDLDVDFETSKGVTAIFGRSGAGKTSVINAIAGLLRPDSGRITINDQVLSDSNSGQWLPIHKRRIGYIFQEARLFPHMSVRKNLEYGRRFLKSDKPQNNELFDRVVAMLGIDQLLERSPQTLSGGERQRVAIGRVLLSDPKLILADEPLSAVDEARRVEILPYFEMLRDEINVPIIYVSHSPGEVARLANRVVVIDNGKIAGIGDANQMLADPAMPWLGIRQKGAVFEGYIVKHHDDGLSEIMANGTRFFLPLINKDEGAKVRVYIKAQDVMLSLTKPTGISALNIVPVTIDDIQLGDGPGGLVQLLAGDLKLVSRVTRRSISELKVQKGQAVFAVIKAVSVARDAIGS